MNEPRAIRIFDNKEEADRACEIVKRGGFVCYVKEDKFGDLTLPEVRIPARFRLLVEKDDIEEIGIYLANKLN